LRDGEFIEIKSSDIQVGDLILMKEDEVFPADMIILASSNKGDAYIQTSSLDGEKNLKKRSKPKEIEKFIFNSCDPDRIIFLGECVSEMPNSELYLYTGKMNICGENFSLTANSMLLKGASLKNTEWVVAFVVFTGDETKLMLNSQKATFKQSKVEKTLNLLVIYIVFAQIFISFTLALIGSFWYKSEEGDHHYLIFSYHPAINGVISFFSYFLLMNTLLPISLVVTLEITKVMQSLYIMMDARMYSEERDKRSMVSQSSIIEELGQVSYIFTDKTGTLTRNVMEFKYLRVGEELYGD
jgi:magnesium-transporting ATPase (P-type)